jgi:hypothetical protein
MAHSPRAAGWLDATLGACGGQAPRGAHDRGAVEPGSTAPRALSQTVGLISIASSVVSVEFSESPTCSPNPFVRTSCSSPSKDSGFCLPPVAVYFTVDEPGSWKGLVAMAAAARERLSPWEVYRFTVDEFRELDDAVLPARVGVNLTITVPATAGLRAMRRGLGSESHAAAQTPTHG